jgi:hypothetical protein
MGAGQGRQRRTRSASASSYSVWHPSKWSLFLASHGQSSNPRAAAYYELEVLGAAALSPEVKLRLMEEVFRDALAVGAIDLPDDVQDKDLHLFMRGSDIFIADSRRELTFFALNSRDPGLADLSGDTRIYDSVMEFICQKLGGALWSEVPF